MLASFEYHIVRIRRSGPDNPDGFSGVVEKVGEKRVQTFNNFEELKKILSSDLRTQTRLNE